MLKRIRAANRVPTLRVPSDNGNHDNKPFPRVFPPTSYASETVPITTPPCHILPTNQETPIHKGPSTTGLIQTIRYGMEERFTFQRRRAISYSSAGVGLEHHTGDSTIKEGEHSGGVRCLPSLFSFHQPHERSYGSTDREGTIHLQTSMSSPGLEPRPYGTAVSIANHIVGDTSECLDGNEHRLL
ncbi:hypothetical protein TNCV_5015281 [Trichonephila clavipes]|nr:hypothetical protein TNCV_5015281 [Trichonephila clavipes]